MKNIIIYSIGGHEEAYMCDESTKKSRPATQDEIDILTNAMPYKIVNGIITLDTEAIKKKREEEYKSCRSVYIDAYRKYQAAINYGQYQRVSGVDEFIRRLEDKDWSTLNSIPPQLKYFTGEISFNESGLIKE